VTELLVKHGATVNVSDLWKFTPLHEAAAKAGGRTSLTIYSALRIRYIYPGSEFFQPGSRIFTK
jgi:hypothetical protein